MWRHTSVFLCLHAVSMIAAQTVPIVSRFSYVLGPDDQILIRAVLLEEIGDKPFRVDSSGTISVPLAGRIQASGLTVEQLETELSKRLKNHVKEPQVSISIMEFRSQPVSVLGAVKDPGVHQVEGRKTLVEVLSLAGGITADAGHLVRITRRIEWGMLPLPGAAADSSGQFTIGSVSLKSILDAKRPGENILVLPYDVVSVPKAEMIYVVGEVKKAGGFVLQSRESMSVLQAVAMAEGLNPMAAAQNCKILRVTAGSNQRTEIPVDLKRTLGGKAQDVPMQADDILFVPNSAVRRITIRTIETAVNLGTGIVIWRR